jgi:hypothetical protein
MAVMSPLGQRIPIRVFLVLGVAKAPTVSRSSIVPDGLDLFASLPPAVLSGSPSTHELVLRLLLVFQAARFAAIREGWQGLRVQALAFERVVDGTDRPVADDNDIGETDRSEERSDDIEVGIGLGFLAIM